MKVLVLGVTGMLGSMLFRSLGKDSDNEVWGTCRSKEHLGQIFGEDSRRLIDAVDAMDFDTVDKAVRPLRPDVVINSIGIVRQLKMATEAIPTITINALFPHRLGELCKNIGARFIHLSTDCVFSGKKGNYKETDTPDAEDLYGRTKTLGEIHDKQHCLTMRTGFIGHELGGGPSLIEWFLSQKEDARLRGYTHGIYSGFPTVELARIIKEYVLPDTSLHGLYQVSGHPISKYDLLKLVAELYGKKVILEPFDGVREDKSLDSSRFCKGTGYVPLQWRELVARMYVDYMEWDGYRK